MRKTRNRTERFLVKTPTGDDLAIMDRDDIQGASVVKATVGQIGLDPASLMKDPPGKRNLRTHRHSEANTGAKIRNELAAFANTQQHYRFTDNPQLGSNNMVMSSHPVCL